MKDMSIASQNIVNNIKDGNDVFAKVKSEDLSVEQKQAVKYFFERLHRVYQAEYRRHMPDESTQRAVKQEFADRVMNIPKLLMDKGFDSLHDELGNPQSEYRFMKIDAVIELIKTGGNAKGVQDGSYKVFKPALPIPPSLREKRRQAGIENCGKLLDFLND